MMFPAMWGVYGHCAGCECECGWGVGVLLAGWKAGGKQGEWLEGGHMPLWHCHGVRTGSIQYEGGAVLWGVVVGLDVGF